MSNRASLVKWLRGLAIQYPKAEFGEAADLIERDSSLTKTAKAIIVEELMPNIAGLAIQDYARLNEFLLATEAMEHE